MPGKGAAATFPGESKCMACHATVKAESPAIRTLANYFGEKKPVPWVQVYKLADNVWFSHKRHAKSTCAECHGPVEERDVIVKEKPITMAACMACHDETKAPNECNTCHS